jgi:hypothetical protein
VKLKYNVCGNLTVGLCLHLRLFDCLFILWAGIPQASAGPDFAG